MKDNMKEISKYLYPESKKDNFSNLENLRETLNKIFGFYINEDHFKRVINGEGNEKDKITAIYSSSLQSLAIFDKVSTDIEYQLSFDFIPNVTFTRVFFEYKNKCITWPSSVDVVLTSSDYKHVLFIESKLYEIISDSVSEKKNEFTSKSNNHNVVGISYYRGGDCSYCEALKIGKSKELKDLGFVVPGKPKEYGTNKLENPGVSPINPIGKYTYPYGIKQFLSHIIGILNVFDPDDNKCDKDLEDKDIENIYFMTLYNSLPGYIKEDKNSKIRGFVNHYRKVESLLKSKNLTINNKNINIQFLGIRSYQSIFKNNDYIKNIKKVKKFYHI